MRIVWVVLLFFANAFVIPVYWYLYIWKTVEPREEPARTPY
jgi:phage shock protein PspC (stress-responsive transcriptional regulator)